MSEYLPLLLAYQALPRFQRRSTFMEIAGYPHYENVCSNILAFYFDPDAEHGLGDLLVTSFLKMTGWPDIRSFGPMSVIVSVTISQARSRNG